MMTKLIIVALTKVHKSTGIIYFTIFHNSYFLSFELIQRIIPKYAIWVLFITEITSAV